MLTDIPEPWRSFLRDVDELIDNDPQLAGPIEFHCVGGFVISMCYSLERTTADLDVFEVLPIEALGPLIDKAGKGSTLAEKHGVYIDAGSRVATIPDNYTERLTEVFAGTFRNIRLFVPDPYDLALSKLERNLDRDIEDVQLLATQAKLDVGELQRRYEAELRPIVTGDLRRHDGTIKLWIEMITELHQSRQDDLDR